MNETAFAFEVGCTLCVQVTVIVAATFALQRWLGEARAGCRLWTACFLSILAFGNRKSALVRRSDRLVKLALRTDSKTLRHPTLAIGALIVLTILIQQIWLPTNAMASSRSDWSPWPTWTAKALHHSFDISVRDFEQFDERSQIHELLEDDSDD